MSIFVLKGSKCKTNIIIMYTYVVIPVIGIEILFICDNIKVVQWRYS